MVSPEDRDRFFIIWNMDFPVDLICCIDHSADRSKDAKDPRFSSITITSTEFQHQRVCSAENRPAWCPTLVFCAKHSFQRNQSTWMLMRRHRTASKMENRDTIERRTCPHNEEEAMRREVPHLVPHMVFGKHTIS
jgi:hypothetical protein